MINNEAVAQLFHETYERLAPLHDYSTRPESAVPWEQVPAANRQLMVATVAHVLSVLKPDIERAAIQWCIDTIRLHSDPTQWALRGQSHAVELLAPLLPAPTKETR